jgi:hypothetical protein
MEEATMNFIPSYTFYNDFDNCPHKAWRKYIKKDLPYEEKTEAQHKGVRMHTAMENAINKELSLPEEWQEADTLVNLLQNMPDTYQVRAEYKLAMTMDGPCAYDAQAAWFRGKLDLVVMHTGAWIIDWKTGKVREDKFELECQALLLKTNHPDLDPIVGEYYWFINGKPGKRYTLTPDVTFVTLRNKWVQMKQFEEKKDFPKRPNSLCGWCPVKDCEYNTVGK